MFISVCQHLIAETLILNDENELKSVMKSELREIKKQYATPRKTEIKSEITEIKIDELDSIIFLENTIIKVNKIIFMIDFTV